jgi:hypothetical protein
LSGAWRRLDVSAGAIFIDSIEADLAASNSGNKPQCLHTPSVLKFGVPHSQYKDEVFTETVFRKIVLLDSE